MAWILLALGIWLIFINLQSLMEKVKNLTQAKAAREWPSAKGSIIASSVDEGKNYSSETGQQTVTYRPSVVYGYNVGGTAYQANRIAFGSILFYQPTEAQAFLEAHMEGMSIPVYYDPKQPSEAVLDTNPDHATRLVAADFAMMGFGVGSALLGIMGLSGVL
ncbi:MAG: DUF3592 domain-containing protein [Candidatus Methylacidiphilales bacterium]|nr:DUF3592 domain-containing protein [Candidatus Methylacidiphilales bacterium]